MAQSAVEELHASGPAHRGFFSALFCCRVVVEALAAEYGGNVLAPASPHCCGGSYGACLSRAFCEQPRWFFLSRAPGKDGCLRTQPTVPDRSGCQRLIPSNILIILSSYSTPLEPYTLLRLCETYLHVSCCY